MGEDVYDRNSVNRPIQGVKRISFKKKYKQIPGYWVRIELNEDKRNKTIKQKIAKEIPRFWLEQHLFFPEELMHQRKMEKMWMQKYNLMEERNDLDAWKLFFREGKSHLEAGRFDIARAAFLCIYKNNPFFLKKYKRYYVFEDLAYYYEAEEELHNSIRCLKIQASLQPDSVEAYLNMSNFLLLSGLVEEAIDVCKRGLLIAPDDAYLINNLLIGYVHGGYYEIALSYLEDRIEKYPYISMNWKLLGDIFCQIENDKAAIICYKKALYVNSEDIYEVEQDIYCSLGICYQELCEIKKAILYYEKFLKMNHEDEVVLTNLSKIYRDDLKEYDKAEYYAKKVVVLYPENGYGYHHLGLVYLYAGRLEKAKWYLYKARKLLPNYQPIHDAIVALKGKYIAF